MQSRVLRYAFLFGGYVSLSAPAQAYLDGATASILLQAIIGAVTTWVVYSRSLIARGRAFLSALISRGHSPGAE